MELLPTTLNFLSIVFEIKIQQFFLSIYRRVDECSGGSIWGLDQGFFLIAVRCDCWWSLFSFTFLILGCVKLKIGEKTSRTYSRVRKNISERRLLFGQRKRSEKRESEKIKGKLPRRLDSKEQGRVNKETRLGAG